MGVAEVRAIVAGGSPRWDEVITLGPIYNLGEERAVMVGSHLVEDDTALLALTRIN